VTYAGTWGFHEASADHFLYFLHNTHTHTRTNTRTHTYIYTYVSLSLSLSLWVCHTHTHTHTCIYVCVRRVEVTQQSSQESERHRENASPFHVDMLPCLQAKGPKKPWATVDTRRDNTKRRHVACLAILPFMFPEREKSRLTTIISCMQAGFDGNIWSNLITSRIFRVSGSQLDGGQAHGVHGGSTTLIRSNRQFMHVCMLHACMHMYACTFARMLCHTFISVLSCAGDSGDSYFFDFFLKRKKERNGSNRVKKITSLFFFVMMTINFLYRCSKIKTQGWHFLKWHDYVIAARTCQVHRTMRRSMLCFALAAVPVAAFLPAAPRSTPSLRVCGGIQMVADTQKSRRKVLGTAAALAGERNKRMQIYTQDTGEMLT